MIKKSKSVPVRIRRLQEKFKRWRAGKQGRERIPPMLWGAATKLCQTHSIHRVSRWLRLNYTALHKRADKRLSPRPSQPQSKPKPAFVEWSLPPGGFPGASSAEYVVEMADRGDGAQRIHVRGASVSEVAALAQALRARGSRDSNS